MTRTHARIRAHYAIFKFFSNVNTEFSKELNIHVSLISHAGLNYFIGKQKNYQKKEESQSHVDHAQFSYIIQFYIP